MYSFNNDSHRNIILVYFNNKIISIIRHMTDTHKLQNQNVIGSGKMNERGVVECF